MITKHKGAFNEKITNNLRLLYQGTKSREYLSIMHNLNTFCEFVKKKTDRKMMERPTVGIIRRVFPDVDGRRCRVNLISSIGIAAMGLDRIIGGHGTVCRTDTGRLPHHRRDRCGGNGEGLSGRERASQEALCPQNAPGGDQPGYHLSRPLFR